MTNNFHSIDYEFRKSPLRGRIELLINIINFANNLSMRTKLLVIMLLVGVVPLGISTIISTTGTKRLRDYAVGQIGGEGSDKAEALQYWEFLSF